MIDESGEGAATPEERSGTNEIGGAVDVGGSSARADSDTEASSNRLDDLAARVAAIEARNRRAERDKAWETSWSRRVAITVLTYLVIVVYFVAAGLPDPLVNSVVPAVALVLATMTLPWVKRVWIEVVYDPEEHRPHGP